MNANANIDDKELVELLKSYYQGKLSDTNSREIKNRARQDEFLAEAMEGFDEFPEAINSIPSFKSSKISKIWISIGAIALLSIAAFFILNSSEPKIEYTSVATVTKEKLVEKEEIIEVIKPTVSEEEIVVPVTKIKPKKEKPKAAVPAKKEASNREYFEIPKMELNPIEIKQKTNYTIKKAKTKSLLYHNFLAIDYSVIYANTIPVEDKFSGIDASKPNKTEKGIETGKGTQTRTITYREQLKNSLYELKVHNYNLAIENFEIILTHFPQDANAQFYIGYALFYQENYEVAISYFEKTMNNGFDFFYEDAEWFKANCLENMGKLKEAQKMYGKIKDKGGYYSYQVE